MAKSSRSVSELYTAKKLPSIDKKRSLSLTLSKSSSVSKYAQEISLQPHARVPSLVRPRPNRRPRKRIRTRIRINIKHNTRHIPLIQTRARHTTRRLYASTTANFQIQTLRIQLRPVVVLAAVQGDDFVPDDVVAWCEFRRQDGGGDEPVLDEAVGDPGSWGDDGGLGDFGPAEGGGGEGCAVACRGTLVSSQGWRLMVAYRRRARCS